MLMPSLWVLACREDMFGSAWFTSESREGKQPNTAGVRQDDLVL